MSGNPQYDVGDMVRFTIDNRIVVGEVYIVDAYGTFFYNDDVCYDILVKEEDTLYKHIPETWVERIEE